MLTHALAAVLILGAVPPPSVAWTPTGASWARGQEQDTILTVRRGESLVVKNLKGRILVEGWERDEVEVETEGAKGAVELRREGSSIRVRGKGSEDGEEARTYHLRVPGWMGVEIRGIDLNIEVEGVDGGLIARTVEGTVFVKGAHGTVDARSVDGVVDVEDVVGDVVVSSGDDDVIVRNVRGAVRAENVDGDIRLRGVEGARVDAETVDGDVQFDGVLRTGGEYRLVTHDGDIDVRVPDHPDVRVLVSTHEGEFRSDFSIIVDRITGGDEFTFTLGKGGAELRLEAFDGDIRLLRR